MTVIRQYDGSTWVPIMVGAQGPPGESGGSGFHVRDFGADGSTSGTVDETAAIQAAINAARDQLQQTAGAVVPDRTPEVHFSPGVYYCTTGLTVHAGIKLKLNGSELRALDAGPLVTLNGHWASIEDGLLRGLGAGTDVIGIHIPAGKTWCQIRRCFFDGFANSAILVEGNVARITDCHAQNSVLNTTSLVAPRGALHIEGSGANDAYVTNCEFTASRTSLSSTGFAYAVVILGKAGSFDGIIAEISDHGFYINGVHNKFSNCRADLNRGHGWVFAGGDGDLSSCSALSNGRETTNTYDGFYATGGSYRFSSCSANVLSTLTAVKHRYGFNHNVAATTTGSQFGSTCYSDQHATTAIKPGTTFAVHAAKIEPTVGPFINTSGTGTTWDVQTYRWPHNAWNLAAINVRNLNTLTNGVPGQRVTLRGDGNTTLVHNASFAADSFRMIGAANILTAVHTLYEFVNLGGYWVEV